MPSSTTPDLSSSLLSQYDIAQSLFPRESALPLAYVPTATGYAANEPAHVTTGTATSASSDGSVWVLPDNRDVDDPQSILCSTTVDVRSGDKVTITIRGASYVVTGVIGGGDRMQAEVDAAADSADVAANQAATANQQLALEQESLNTAQAAILALQSQADQLAIDLAAKADNQDITDLTDALADYDLKADREAIISQDATGIHIGEDGFKATFGATALTFSYQDEVKAYYGVDRSEAINLHARKSLSVGRTDGANPGWFQWSHEDDGSMSLSHRGNA